MTANISLFDEVVVITERYLGPAARRFIARQVSFHLNKAPEALMSTDIPQLVEWTKATLALLTEDKSMVDGFAQEVMKLSPPR